MSTGLDIAILRTGAVLAPVLLAAGLWLAAATVRLRAAAFLAVLWNVCGLIAVNVIAVQRDWWSFGTTGLEWAGFPVDVVLGWAVLWGAVPVLLIGTVSPAISALALILADLLAMGSLAPLVTLHSRWWWGEVLAVSTCLLPGLVLGYLTVHRRALRLRVGLQVVLFGATLFGLIPALAFGLTQQSWSPPRPSSPLFWLGVQLTVLIGVVALRAVAEFTKAGGTPYPWDPPARLVTGGPYAYLANPMQWCGSALLLVLAIMLGSTAIAAGAVVAVAFSAGLASWHEHADLAHRFGAAWSDYRRHVRNWWPRWRPAPTMPSATLYIAGSCDPCSAVGTWIADRGPTALRIADAESHREQLRRVRYEADDGTVLDGTRALGAAAVHLTLAYSVFGWLVRAPGVAWFVQLLADAVGAGPRALPVQSAAPPR